MNIVLSKSLFPWFRTREEMDSFPSLAPEEFFALLYAIKDASILDASFAISANEIFFRITGRDPKEAKTGDVVEQMGYIASALSKCQLAYRFFGGTGVFLDWKSPGRVSRNTVLYGHFEFKPEEKQGEEYIVLNGNDILAVLADAYPRGRQTRRAWVWAYLTVYNQQLTGTGEGYNRGLDTICEKTGVAMPTCSRYLNELESMDLLRLENKGRGRKNLCVYTTPRERPLVAVPNPGALFMPYATPDA